MKKLKVKDIRKMMKGLSPETFFEINISDGKCGQRSTSFDIMYTKEVELGVATRQLTNSKLAYINIIAPELVNKEVK